MNRHPGRWEPGDEVWYGPDGQKVYRQPDNVPSTSWVQIIDGMASEPATGAPGRPQPVQVDVAATPDPEPIPLTRAGRIRNAVSAVRRGDKAAVDVLRELLMGE